MITIAKQTKMRPFTLDDAQAVTDLINAHSQSLFGQDTTSLNENMNDWTTPGLELEKMIRVVENDQGEIIGYVDVWDISDPHVKKYIWAVLHPDAWDEERYFDMLEWAEDCACERIELAPPDARVVINQGISNKDLARKKALEAYGFDLVRHFYRMEIALDTPLKAAELPEGLTLCTINLETELKDVVLAMDEAFSDHWGHVSQPIDQMMAEWQHYIANSEDFDPTLWFLAKDANQIAGICRCSPKTTEDPDMGWVNQLCVRKPWRRKGLGMALLQHAFNVFQQRGSARAGLAVDASSLTNATRLYEKAGMHISRQFDSYELVLREGVDLVKK